MALVLTIPQTTLQVGPVTFSSANINSAFSRVLVSVNQVGWPGAGNKAWDYEVFVSLDAGANWRLLCYGDNTDVPATGGVIKLGCGIPSVDLTTRRLRVTFDIAKTLTFSGTLEAF